MGLRDFEPTPIDPDSLADLSDDELAELHEKLELLHLEEQRQDIVAFALNTEVPGTPSPYSENDRIKLLKRKEALSRAKNAAGDYEEVEDVEREDDDVVEFYPHQLEVHEHQQMILEVMQGLMEEEPIVGPLANGFEGRYADGVILMFPPGASKSTYASVVAPAWIAGRYAGTDVITLSYGADLARRFGRRVRHICRQEKYERQMGATVVSDNQAVDQWSLTNGSTYKATGILGGVTGNRADCLVGNTLIETPSGHVRIDRISVGDYVRSYDRKSQRPIFRRVLAVARREASELWRIRTAAGHVLEATGNHRFYANGAWNNSASLAPGDVLLRTVQQGDVEVDQGDGARHPQVLQPGVRIGAGRRHGPINAFAERIARFTRQVQDTAKDVVDAQRGYHGPATQPLSAQSVAAAGRLRLRDMRHQEAPAGPRGHQGQLAAEVLLHGLRDAGRQSSARIARQSLQSLRQARHPRACVLEGVSTCYRAQERPRDSHGFRAFLRDLRRRIQAHYEHDSRALLLDAVQLSGTSRAHGRPRQSRLEGWSIAQPIPGGQWAEVQGGQEGGAGARWPSLRSLLSQFKSAWASHRRREHEQHAGQHRDPVCPMPLGISRSGAGETATDSVAVVERVREDHLVYDIQVEETQCFFANGILVHNCVILDDPIAGRDEAESDIIRNKTWDAFKDDVLTRLKPRGKCCVIATRWHEDDPIGRILGEGWDGQSGLWEGVDKRLWLVLCVPLVASRDDDPLGRARGERLWPTHFDDRFVELARAQGDRTWNSLYQQRPSASDGNILLKSAWRCWPHGKAEMTPEQKAHPEKTQPPEFGKWRQCVLVYDTALEDDEDDDYSAMTAWVTFETTKKLPQRKMAEEKMTNILMTGAWRKKVPASELLGIVLAHIKQFQPDRVVIEKRASGIQLIQELRKRRPRHQYGEVIIDAWLPPGPVGAKGKKPRAHAASLSLTEGSVWYMPGAIQEAVIKECASFPNGRNDDWTDTVTCMISYARTTNLLEIAPDALSDEEIFEAEADEVEAQAHPKGGYGNSRAKPYTQTARSLYGRSARA